MDYLAELDGLRYLYLESRITDENEVASPQLRGLRVLYLAWPLSEKAGPHEAT